MSESEAVKGAPTQEIAEVIDYHPDEYYLHERYKTPQESKKTFLSLYYILRPLLPRMIQLALRRRYARFQARRRFPAWPIEPILVEKQYREIKSRIEMSGNERIPFIHFWPHGSRAAVVLTHDVETAEGVANIPRVRKVEEKYGLVSSWNFVPERYRFDKGIFRQLTEAQCEIGVHGLYHDGKLFSSSKIFRERVPKINAYLKSWGAAGFRSPATHRNPDWMPMISAAYDSSFPDTDPFEPQPGGCCSIFPFFLESMVELPITMPQDHTLFEILAMKDIEVWKQKASWIIRHHGMVLVLVHPDYVIKEENLKRYDELLGFLTSHQGLWHALPRDVAQWWRARASLSIRVGADGKPLLDGPRVEGGALAWAYIENNSVRFSLEEESS